MNKKLITFLLAILFVQLCVAEVITVSQVTQGKPTVDKGKQDAQKEFKARFQKKYKPAETDYRVSVFLANKAAAEAHNKDTSNTEKMGITKFSDLTQAEFSSRYLKLKIGKKAKPLSTADKLEGFKPPNVDWVGNKKVTPIKDQGNCGSCWAFSAAAALESAIMVSNVPGEPDVSEQELVDCSKYDGTNTDYGNAGCDGGWMSSAYDYIIDNGLSSEDNYPYMAEDQECGDRTPEFHISTYKDKSGCNALAEYIKKGPVTVAVDASNWGSYVSGTFKKCAKKFSLNHGVVVVGSNKNAWLVKNSWGTDWGENGFIRIAMGETCGICSYPVLPVL